jgi:hypothetical protein
MSQIRCLTLFVTHYPLLAGLSAVFPREIENYHMAFMQVARHQRHHTTPSHPGRRGKAARALWTRSQTMMILRARPSCSCTNWCAGLQLKATASTSHVWLGPRISHSIGRISYNCRLPPSILHLATAMSRQLEQRVARGGYRTQWIPRGDSWVRSGHNLIRDDLAVRLCQLSSDEHGAPSLARLVQSIHDAARGESDT